MVFSAKDDHPYWYARILGIFHARVRHRGGEPAKKDFLWVRWYGHVPGHRAGWKARRLPLLGFLEDGSPDAYGFLDPDEVIRGVHLIPAFNFSHFGDMIPPTKLIFARKYKDWIYYYVNM